MTIRWKDGHILWSGGHIATSDDCCCDVEQECHTCAGHWDETFSLTPSYSIDLPNSVDVIVSGVDAAGYPLTQTACSNPSPCCSAFNATFELVAFLSGTGGCMLDVFNQPWPCHWCLTPVQSKCRVNVFGECGQDNGSVAAWIDRDGGTDYYWFARIVYNVASESTEVLVYRSSALVVGDECLATKGTFSMTLVDEFFNDGGSSLPYSHICSHPGSVQLIVT